MLLEVQHRGHSHVIDCRRRRPEADGISLTLSHNKACEATELQAEISTFISGAVGDQRLAVPANGVQRNI